jgi:hypothetical protein
MAIAIRVNDFEPGPGTERYDAVMAEVRMADEPPAGLIFHWAGEVDGEWTVTGLWESREAFDRFREERLFPAVRAVAGVDPATGRQPTVTEFEVHHYVRP